MDPGATLIELAREIAGAAIVRGAETTRVADVRHDSRDVSPGDLFVARRGRKSDGARFVADALARGASAVMSESDLEGTFPLLRVPDAEIGLAFASGAVWRHPSFALEVVGITGTNGKTTTAWLVEHALTRLGMHAGLLGTVEHRYGELHWPALHTTPEADDLARRMAAMRDAGAEHVVMEVSSHAVALHRVAAIRFRVAALTNVTQDHLDFHGTFENYANAKRALFLERGPAACVLNLDDAVGLDLAARIHGAITYSARGNADATLRAESPDIDATGIVADVVTPQGRVQLRSPLVGRHNLENLLAALGILLALDVAASRACEALADATGAPGRLERVRRGHDVFVDYAHTPDALTNVLGALRPMTRGRLICVFGCGGDRDPTKRAPMGRAVARGADVAVLTTDNPRTEDPATIASQAEAGLRAESVPKLDAIGDATRGYVVELDRRRAISLAVSAAQPGDVVIVAGKGHEPYQEIHGVRTAFDDREEAARALEARRG